MPYAKRTYRSKRRNVKRRAPYKKRAMRMRPRRAITTNTASVKENYGLAVPDGNVTFFRNIQLADIIYDRAQQVAQAYQEYRIKYVKITFIPNADTFPAVAGNVIPQLYFMIDKTNALPTNADAGTFYSMGCRPRRMDDKNLVYAWKPSALVANFVGPNVTTASELKIRPWLSTNANSGAGAGVWAPSSVDHMGCAFYVTKINPNDNLQYNVDVEVVFQFRKPLWKGTQSGVGSNQTIKNGQIVPLLTETTQA